MSTPTFYRVGLLLQVTASLTIRAAPLDMVVDAATYRRHRGGEEKVVIPSTSIKGALRQAACIAAPSIGLTCCGEKNPEKLQEAHQGLGDKGLLIDGKRLCHVCGLFGATGHRGYLATSDAEPVEPLVTAILPGIEIDDYTGTVSRGKLFFREAVPPGYLFTTWLEVDSDVSKLGDGCWWIRLLAAAVPLLEAVGIGSGAARAWITVIEAAQEAATEAESAARLLGCSDESTQELLRKAWLIEKTITLTSLQKTTIGPQKKTL